jgi:hypothetical protein
MTDAPAIGEVHAVGGRRDDQVGPQHKQDGAEDGTAERKVQPGNVPHQRDLGGRRSHAVGIGKVQCQDGENDADSTLQYQLGFGVQAQAALLGNLDEVVQESHQAHPHHEEQQQERGGGRAG